MARFQLKPDTIVTSQGKKKSEDRIDNAYVEGQTTGQRVTREKNLSDLEKEYLKIPEMLKKQYAADAAADQLAPTDDFNGNSMDSALQAGGRGARVANQERQNALRVALGGQATPYSSATNANTAGIPGSTSNPDAAVLPPSTATGAVGPTALMVTEEEETNLTGKPRQKALKNAAGAQSV